jgi:hypothetical protein
MSSADNLDLRPKRPVRIVVLIAAVACLGLTMCVRSEQKRPPATPRPTTQQGQTQEPQPPQQAKPDEGDMPKSKPDYFPATKAPGGFYR